MIPNATIDQLVGRGQRLGRLSVADIEKVLPLDTIVIEEIEDLVARLEAAGVVVEIETAFLLPRPRNHCAEPSTSRAEGHSFSSAPGSQQPPATAPSAPSGTPPKSKFDLRHSRTYVRRSPKTVFFLISVMGLSALAIWIIG